jgi:hypothetical protein
MFKFFMLPAIAATLVTLHTFQAEIYNRSTGTTVNDTVQSESETGAMKLFQDRYPGCDINFLHEVGG